MKKSKLLKSLAALAVGILTAISCIGLVACGGGDPAVNSVRLNKTELTLKVGGNETLTATTDPVGATVTWTSADSTKVEVDQTGKVTAKAVTTTPVLITAKAGEKSATCNVTVEEAAPTWPKTYTYDSELLFNNVNDTTPADKLALKEAYFAGENSFINVTESDKNVMRLNNAKTGVRALEFKETAFTVTFEGTGTLTIGFTGTGSDTTKNISGLAVKNAAGTCLTGTVDPNGATATLITAEDDTENNGYNVGFYRVIANNVATVTFNITEAGTYTVWCGNYGKKEDTANPGNYLPTNKTATHVRTIQMVDNGPQA